MTEHPSSTAASPAAESTTDFSTDEDASIDTDSSTEKWRLFERTIAAAESQLDKSSVVKHDQRVIGQESGTPRQIDVLAYGQVIRSQLSVVVECKRYAKRIGIGKVDEFIGKLQDVGAPHGILYAYSGVTGPALARAMGARRPTVEIRDFTDTEAELRQSAQESPSTSFEELLAALAQRSGEELALDIERKLTFNCQAGTGCHGVVDMDDYDDEIATGVCEQCGSLHVLCECDGAAFYVYNQSDSESCWCGAVYSVTFTPDAELRGVDLVRHGYGCDGSHASGVPVAPDPRLAGPWPV